LLVMPGAEARGREARADVAPSSVNEAPSPAEPCSVIRKCSAAGLDCDSNDRACANEATTRGLEVVCERPDYPAKHFVYCPPGGGSRDSRVVWVLLGAAIS